MKNYILILSIFLFITGCASVSEDYRYDKGTKKLYLYSKLVCKGIGCKADHNKRTVENVTLPNQIAATVQAGNRNGGYIRTIVEPEINAIH